MFDFTVVILLFFVCVFLFVFGWGQAIKPDLLGSFKILVLKLCLVFLCYFPVM